jgi:predicted nucleotidyltransferase
MLPRSVNQHSRRPVKGTRLGQIRNYCTELARVFHPEKIILFGSYAYGKPTLDSDVDLMVILPFPGNEINKAAEIRAQFDAPFPLDLLVRKPHFIAERLRERDMFIELVMEKGVILYEGQHA